MDNHPPKLLDQVRALMRQRHYALRTEKAYLGWIKRFILFHHKRHPQEMGIPEIEAFLTDLAITGHVTASTVRLSSRRSPKSGLQCPVVSVSRCLAARVDRDRCQACHQIQTPARGHDQRRSHSSYHGHPRPLPMASQALVWQWLAPPRMSAPAGARY